MNVPRIPEVAGRLPFSSSKFDRRPTGLSRFVTVGGTYAPDQSASSLQVSLRSALTAHPSAQSPNANHVVAGQILVKFTPGATGQAKADAHRQGGGRVLNEIASTGLQLVAVAAGDETGAINRYRRNPNVLYAEPNFIRSVPEPVGDRTPITHVPGTETIPGDHWFKEQWALHNTGQLFYCVIPEIPDFCFYVGTPDADIDAPEAWAISTGHAGHRGGDRYRHRLHAS